MHVELPSEVLAEMDTKLPDAMIKQLHESHLKGHDLGTSLSEMLSKLSVFTELDGDHNIEPDEDGVLFSGRKATMVGLAFSSLVAQKLGYASVFKEITELNAARLIIDLKEGCRLKILSYFDSDHITVILTDHKGETLNGTEVPTWPMVIEGIRMITKGDQDQEEKKMKEAAWNPLNNW
jgi:hypothetical protein